MIQLERKNKISSAFINQFGHKRSRHRLDMGPISKYLSEIFSSRQIKFTKNDPNKDVKSVNRP